MEHYAIKHEERCFKNPANFRPYFDCQHLEKITVDVYHDLPWGGEVKQEVNVFHCKALDQYLYPPLVEHKKNPIELGEYCNNPMPKECASQKLLFLIENP